ncbi:amidase domain-containing protein [Virgibacillus sp. YIM 98842]|uniref:amidase domain-containing protein n=1 Tax=Virgibacillus sp. YIM 98842 TaxID=2663533 RepID=UPI0013DA559E|nr:amidase domain-containing protein [Virgibacillus sp. YIM 98842]
MEKLKMQWLDFFREAHFSDDWWGRKKQSCEERDAEIVSIQGDGHIHQTLRYDNKKIYNYLLHLAFLIKQKGHFYLEETVISYQFRLKNGEVAEHRKIETPDKNGTAAIQPEDMLREDEMQRFTYDRHAAVQYAERWWNSYNPEFRKFDVDCTNYVSQCLYAGGAPMWGAPNRERGWWYSGDNWSFSWAVAHSLRWYLSGSEQGLKGKEVESASDLIPGDIICYDFEGDGRYDHNTIVVTKDANGMPLVNAHTDNSRNRYWAYEDSAAWTPNIQYKFFRIGEE